MDICTPSRATQSALIKARPGIKVGLAAPSILLVEYAKHKETGHSHLLKLLDCKVDHANSAKEAIKLAKHAYDLVLIDTDLPDLCGLELSKLIKEQHHLIHVPIIALVNSDKSPRHGSVDEFISKPVTPEKLISVLSRWV